MRQCLTVPWCRPDPDAQATGCPPCETGSDASAAPWVRGSAAVRSARPAVSLGSNGLRHVRRSLAHRARRLRERQRRRCPRVRGPARGNPGVVPGCRSRPTHQDPVCSRRQAGARYTARRGPRVHPTSDASGRVFALCTVDAAASAPIVRTTTIPPGRATIHLRLHANGSGQGGQTIGALRDQHCSASVTGVHGSCKRSRMGGTGFTYACRSVSRRCDARRRAAPGRGRSPAPLDNNAAAAVVSAVSPTRVCQRQYRSNCGRSASCDR